MIERENPDAVHPPLGAYSHSIRVPAGAEWLVVSGQVGMNAKGVLASGAQRQTERALRNVLANLRASGYAKRDLVKLVTYLTDSRHIPDYRAARKKVLGDETVPASTLLIIDGLASPDMLVEIEAWAAKSR